MDHKKDMMRSPRNHVPLKSNRHREVAASMASEAAEGAGAQDEAREPRPSQQYVQLSKDHYAQHPDVEHFREDKRTSKEKLKSTK